MKRLLIILLVLFAVAATAKDDDKAEKRKKNEISQLRKDTEDLKRQVWTIRNAVTGRPEYQGQNSKVAHSAEGSVKLAAGKVIVTFNTDIDEGRQDQSFTNYKTYRIEVWSLDTANTAAYMWTALSGAKFQIRSDDPADTATVQYRAEGH
jgi:hypothetical protein